MHISYIQGAMAQLNDFADRGLELDAPEVIESNFYQFMQTATALSAKDTHELTLEALILLARIAATSPTLHTLNLSNNHLGEHVVDVAAHLCQSKSLRTVDLSYNNSAEYAVAAAEIFNLHNQSVVESNVLAGVMDDFEEIPQVLIDMTGEYLTPSYNLIECNF